MLAWLPTDPFTHRQINRLRFKESIYIVPCSNQLSRVQGHWSHGQPEGVYQTDFNKQVISNRKELQHNSLQQLADILRSSLGYRHKRARDTSPMHSFSIYFHMNILLVATYLHWTGGHPIGMVHAGIHGFRYCAGFKVIRFFPKGKFGGIPYPQIHS